MFLQWKFAVWANSEISLPKYVIRVCVCVCVCVCSVIQSCLTLWDPMDYSTPGLFVHGISQARIME